MALLTSSRIRKLRPPLPRGIVGLVLAGIVFALAPQAEGQKERSGKPRVYNLIVRAGEPIDRMIREVFGRKFDVVEFRQDRTYVEPKLTKTSYPNPVFDDANVEVTGSVRVCFVVSLDGRLVDPVIYHSASPRLEGPVLSVLKEFRASPARLNGAPIATVEALKFTFGPGPRRRIFSN